MIEAIIKKGDWREAKAQTKIRQNQLWKKKDTGRVVRIRKRTGGSCWMCCFATGEGSHSIKEKDLYKFFELI